MATHIGGNGGDGILGTKWNDFLQGAGGDDVIKGFGRDDNINGGDGRDKLYGGDGNDVVYGGAGADKIYGGDGRDYLVGGKGNDLINGGNGDDLILGGQGNDRIIGGKGDDVLRGDYAKTDHYKDTFVFGKDSGKDVILDFDVHKDVLEITKGLNNINSAKDVLKHASQHGDNVVIDLGGGNKITLKHVDLDDLKKHPGDHFDIV